MFISSVMDASKANPPRQALEDLTTDEAELSRLESEQLVEIQAMRISGSKNFDGVAVLKGKRATLWRLHLAVCRVAGGMA